MNKKLNFSLNPCFVGKCSTSHQRNATWRVDLGVLILVLLENALRVDED